MEDRQTPKTSLRDQLTQIDQQLLASPADPRLVLKKAALLFRLHEYGTCYDLLSTVSLTGSDKRRSYVRQVKSMCQRFQRIRQSIADAQTLLAEQCPESWYADRLWLYVRSEDAVKRETEEEHMTWKVPTDKACILGQERGRMDYRGSDIGCVFCEFPEKMKPFPLAQSCEDGFMYLKSEVFPLIPHRLSRKQLLLRYDGPSMTYDFPKANWSSLYEVTKPNEAMDVYYSYTAIDRLTHKMLRWSLDEIGRTTQDFFVPQYQNLIDPNLTVTVTPESGDMPVWTATDFLIEESILHQTDLVCTLQLIVKWFVGRSLPWHTVRRILDFAFDGSKVGRARIASTIADLDPVSHVELYASVESIVNAALPALSRICRPALLLPGKLQAVVKGQRIYLEDGQEYEGVWHFDGKHEHIVAVVLYFYRYSDGIQGGDLEFVARQPRKELFWLGGDCSPSSWTHADVKLFFDEIPHCKVPVKEGLLCVFSNYQHVHRVLRMLASQTSDPNSPDGNPSRDFLALFVVDQQYPLPTTESVDARLPPLAARKATRYKVFGDQIRPAGQFGIDDRRVYSTGNGSVALVGWMSRFDQPDAYWFDRDQGRDQGVAVLAKLNECPPVCRGGSWAVSDSILDELDLPSSDTDSEPDT